MRFNLSVLALVALCACAPAVPESGAGVGFDNYDDYQKAKQAREAQLAGNALPAPTAVSQESLGGGATPITGAASAGASTGSGIAADAAAVLNETAANSGQEVVHASPTNPPPEAVLSPSGMSKENDFSAVGQQRSIESDAELIAQNKAKYKVIQPTALPSRSGTQEPNIVAYALSSKHPLGTKIYHRINLSRASKYERNCAKFPSPDLAQEEFLIKGGPERDKLGLDPDGDGYACGWDPRPFRKAVNG